MRRLKVRFYGQYVVGAGELTLRDTQRLSDFLNLPDRFLALNYAVTETGARGRGSRDGILLTKSEVVLLVPVGQHPNEEMGQKHDGMLVHKITSRVTFYLPSFTVRAALHHVPGANLAQHLDLRCDDFIPLTEVYVTGSRTDSGGKPVSFRAGFALLNKNRAVAVRLNARGKTLSLLAA